MTIKRPRQKQVALLILSLFVMGTAYYLLVLGPVYSLAGPTAKSVAEQDAILRRASVSSQIFIGLMLASILVILAELLVWSFKHLKKPVK